jgi:hypothetical protein
MWRERIAKRTINLGTMLSWMTSITNRHIRCWENILYQLGATLATQYVMIHQTPSWSYTNFDYLIRVSSANNNESRAEIYGISNVATKGTRWINMNTNGE